MMKNIKKATLEDILHLRKEIRLNSLYLHDYENSLGFDRNQVYTFFEGYMDYISDIYYADNEHEYDDKFWQEIQAFDTDENLEAYYYSIEIDY